MWSVEFSLTLGQGALMFHQNSRLNRLNKKPIPKESETPMHLLVQKTAIYELQISGTNHEFVNQSCKRVTIRDT